MINCLALDDEPLALKQLGNYIAKTPFLHLAASCHSAKEAFQIIENQSIDVIFTDIEMPDCNGLQFVKSLQNPPFIVFSTAYDSYAIEGYRIDAIDYLLKPYSYQDFLKVAIKVKQYCEWKRNAVAESNSTDSYIFLRCGGQTVRLDFEKILYIEGMSEYIRVHLSDGKILTPFMSIKLIMEALPAQNFMRVHRSYIVALEKIVSFHRTELILQGEITIPVSISYRDDLQRFFDKKSIKKQ